MSVFGPRSLGRSPNLERSTFRGSGHVSFDRSGPAIQLNSLRKEPERIKKIPSAASSGSTTKNPVEVGPYITKNDTFYGEIPFVETTQGPFIIPDGSLKKHHTDPSKRSHTKYIRNLVIQILYQEELFL